MRWPDLATFPDYGLTRTRKDFDEILARTAQKAGARILERTSVSGPVRDDRTGRIVGVTARTTEADGTKHDEVVYRAPIVVAADGNSSRLSVASGRERLENRPMGVAVRTYYRSEAMTHDEWLESHLELLGRRQAAARLRLGLRARRRHGQRRARHPGLEPGVREGRLHARSCSAGSSAPTPRTASPRRPASSRSAAPRFRWPSTASPPTPTACSSSATPAGMVNPFNGEGIAYAMESGQIAAEVMAQALRAPHGVLPREGPARLPPGPDPGVRRLLQPRPRVREAHRQPRDHAPVHPEGAARPMLMKLTMTTLSNLRDPRGGDWTDRVVNALSRSHPPPDRPGPSAQSASTTARTRYATDRPAHSDRRRGTTVGEVYLPILVLGILGARRSALFSVLARAQGRSARSTTTARCSTPTSAASTPRPSPSAAAGSRSSTT